MMELGIFIGMLCYVMLFMMTSLFIYLFIYRMINLFFLSPFREEIICRGLVFLLVYRRLIYIYIHTNDNECIY